MPASVPSWIAQPGPTGSMLRSASIKEFRVRQPRVGRGQAGGPEDQPAETLKPQLSHASLPRTLCPQPCVCSSWEIYGGSINGFYRQLLERAEQGLAVGGPSRRLTAKTLKYYGPTYIKSVLCTSSAASLLLTQEPGVAGSPDTKCLRALAPAPATEARSLWLGWQPGRRETHPKSSARHGLAASSLPSWPAVPRLSSPGPFLLRARLQLFSLS